MADISTLRVNDTAIVELDDAEGNALHARNDAGEVIKDNEGEPVLCSITVFGPGSKQYQKAQGKRNRSIMDAVKKGGKKSKDDDQREVDATFLADCTASFNHFDYKGMTGWDAYKALYMDTGMGFIAEQVNRALGDWSRFSKQAATP